MTKSRNLRIIGLTGGIATGKSSVARFFEKQGATVIDADLLAREAVAPGSKALERIVSLFGPDILLPDGTLNRKSLGKIVFADPAKRRELENIIHPEISRLTDERVNQEESAGARVLFYMAPLIIETGNTGRFDEIWVVTLRPEIQLERLMKRDEIGREEAERVIASQMPLSEKEKHGKIIIDNNGTSEETRRVLIEIWEREIGAIKK